MSETVASPTPVPHPEYNTRSNPYVGPRAFHLNETLFGREKETQALFDLLLAERVVLLHAQSGAGKSSLIQASLIPMLVEDGFNVLPVVRVSKTLAATSTEGVNRYSRSVLLDLEAATAVTGADVSNVSLPIYFEQHASRAKDKPEVLILDQFEEIFTLDMADGPAKEQFFRELGVVLQNRNRWALISMRDDFIGAIAPYQQWLPTRLSHRYRLELLSPKAANDSIRGPAKAVGVDYSDGAVNQLVEDLRTVRQQRGPGEIVNIAGPFIEPVHLQVVCTNLWRRLSTTANSVCETDVETVGDVDSALGEYYANAVAESAHDGKCDEGLLRAFIGTQLVQDGVRAQKLMGTELEAGVTSAAIESLGDRYIIRREDRRGAIWYELAHDRLIGPIDVNNRAWKASNDPSLLKFAEEWDRLGRPNRLLLFANPDRTLRAFLDLNARRQARTSRRAASTVLPSRTPRVVEEYMQASVRVRRIAVVVVIALAAIVAGVSYTVSKMQENSSLKQLLDSIKIKSAALVVAQDSTERVANLLYQKAWGLDDTGRVAVQASLDANRKLQQAVKARDQGRQVSSPAVPEGPGEDERLRLARARAARSEIMIKYFFKRSDPQRVEFALRELGYNVSTAPARVEEIATNAISYGPDVPLADVRVIAFALARTGAQLKRICPLRTVGERQHAVEVIGSTSAQSLSTLTLDQLSTLGVDLHNSAEAVRQLQCRTE
jgi:hypothetical protein